MLTDHISLVILCSSTGAVYRLPCFPRELQAALSSKDSKLFQPGSKFKRLLVTAVYDDLRKRGLL